MSFVRDIEDRLRKSKGERDTNIEDEIPFWEFLDIEYDQESRTFFFDAYYTQKPVFSELFRRFIESRYCTRSMTSWVKSPRSEYTKEHGNQDRK